MSEDLTTLFTIRSVLKLKDTTNDTLYYFIVARAIAKMVTEKLFLVIKLHHILLGIYQHKKSFQLK